MLTRTSGSLGSGPVSILGLQAARVHAEELRRKAQAALARSGLAHVEWLKVLADKVVERDC